MKKEMGIGTVYLMVASMAGILSGYVIHVGLGRYLGPALYGVFGVLMSLFQMNRSFFQAGFPKAAAKYMAESKENVSAVLRSSLRLQLTAALFFAVIYVSLSEVIAAILHDESLYWYIVLIGVMTIPLALQLFYFEGYLNGLRKFKEEAKGKIILTVLRVFFIFLFVALGLELLGALLGYLFSLLFALGIALFLWGMKEWQGRTIFPKKKIIFFALPLLLSSFAMVLLRNVDVLFVKSLLQDDVLAGYYTAASTLAGVPYLVFSALSLTLLPSISRSFAEGNMELTRRYISRSLRYLLMTLLPIIAVAAATATNLLVFFYSSAYQPGGSILFILLFASMFLVIFLTLIMVMAGSGKPVISMIIGFVGALTLAALALLLVPIMGMQGAAIASLCASFVTVVVSGLYVFYKYRTLMPVLSLLRVVFCAGITFLMAWFWNPAGWWLVVAYPLLLLGYILLLYLFREITTEDLDLVKGIIGRVFERG